MPNFIGVNGFLISCATCMAISRHALSRSDRANASADRRTFSTIRLYRSTRTPISSPAADAYCSGSTSTSGPTSIRSISPPSRANGCVMDRVSRKSQGNCGCKHQGKHRAQIGTKSNRPEASKLRDAYRSATSATGVPPS